MEFLKLTYMQSAMHAAASSTTTVQITIHPFYSLIHPSIHDGVDAVAVVDVAAQNPLSYSEAAALTFLSICL